MSGNALDHGRSAVPRATVGETLSVIAAVIGPMLAKGVIIRRPGVLRLAERADATRKAVECMQRLQEKYGQGPLRLRIPGRRQALVFSTAHVHRILEGTPEPFAAATAEKKAALAHFQPRGVLISHGAERIVRRRFNEQVLGNDMPVHRLAEHFVQVVESEVGRSPAISGDGQALSWEAFAEIWFPVVRRVILGDSARDDKQLTAMIDRLRRDANWAFLRPKRTALRTRFHQRLGAYLENAQSGSLAEVIANTPSDEGIAPEDQISHWMFAFDPAGMATFRSLALLVTHPDQAAKARQEISRLTGSSRQHLPYLRACMLESLRLWSTTPIILRETTRETRWENGTLPAGTSLSIFAPYFHRDDRRLPEANSFSPDLWQADRPADNWPLVPFSGGTAVCPARHLVLLLTSAILAALLEGKHYRLESPVQLDPGRPLPHTLNHFTLRFETE